MAYPSHASLVPFLPLYQGKPASLTAFFKPGSDENLIVLPLENAVSLEAIFHEYTHLLLRHNDPFWPLWLKEGMAEIYGTFEVTFGNRARIGQPIKRHLTLLADTKLMSLADLFAVRHESPEYNEEAHQGIFYAQSWLLTHYLMLGPSSVRKAQFAQLTPLLRQGQPPEQAFTNAFRTSPAAMENELRSYLERGKFVSHEFALNTDLSAPRALSWRTISPAETCFRLGDQLLRVGRLDAAESYFEKSKELAPRGPLAFEGLGLLASVRGRSEESVRLLGEALQRGSVSFLAHYTYAREKYRMTSRSPDLYEPIQGATATEIRAELQKSLSLMPSFGPAHHLLGFFELVQGENLASAETHLQKAIQLEPEEQAYVFSMAQVRLMKDGPEAAKRTLEPLRRPYVPAKLRSQVEEMLKDIDKQQRGR
jgi:tetratricopeptide (TPR) repeat protein